MRSIYFNDPNGIALEASWWIDDATGRPGRYDDAAPLRRPRPGARAARAAATGTLASTPATRLVDEVTRDLYRTPDGATVS